MNYGALLASVPLVMIILRRHTDLSPGMAAVASISIGLSPIWHQALFWPSLGTNVISMCFSLAAIAVLFSKSGHITFRRLFVSGVLQVLAVASHETAIIVPLVCAAMMGPERIRAELKRLWPFAMPFVYLFATRLLLPFDGVYAFEGGHPEALLRAVRFVIGPFIPFEAMRMLLWEPAVTLIGNLPLALAITANLAVYVLIIRALFVARTQRLATLLLALVIALVIAIPTNTEPRFMGIALLITMLVVAKTTERAFRLRVSVLSLILVAQAALFIHGVVWTGESQLERVRISGITFDYLRNQIEVLEPDVVVLANDRTGYFGSRAMLQMASWPRENLELVVLNSYGGPPSAEGATDIGVRDGRLHIRVLLGDDQYVRFDGAIPDFSRPNNSFVYHSIEGYGIAPGSFEAGRQLDGRRVAVLGTDLRTGTPFKPVVAR